MQAVRRDAGPGGQRAERERAIEVRFNPAAHPRDELDVGAGNGLVRLAAPTGAEAPTLRGLRPREKYHLRTPGPA